jgi:hypothetical protein
MLSLYYVNATSLAKFNAIECLHTDMLVHTIDVALISETWFTDVQSSCDVSINGYTLFRQDRANRRGGGVCVYVKNGIVCQRFYPTYCNSNTSDGNTIELLWVECNFQQQHYFIAVCYHPPRPKYKCQTLIDALTCDIESIVGGYLDSIVIIVGDFNQLSTVFLECDLGFTQLVHSPTHCNNIIDKCFINRPDVYDVDIISSLVKTKHKALYIHVDVPILASPNSPNTSIVYDLREHNIDRLRHAIGTYDWSSLSSFYLDSDDISAFYEDFLYITDYLVNTNIPFKSVKLRSRDPPFVTPLVKSLLKQRNRLRRRGSVAKADILAEKINAIISNVRSVGLAKLSGCSAKKLWAAVRPQRSAANDFGRILADPSVVNDYFAQICFDSSVSPVTLNHKLDNISQSVVSEISPFEIEHMLRTLKSTSPGMDGLPSWLFRGCSVELAEIVACIFNRSFKLGIVPDRWRTAIVTPIPKVPKTNSLADFRPISVTPILSRLAEKLFVRHWLRPSIPPQALIDQYAFKPSGSTTCALIHFAHFASQMLETNSYVRCLLIDFSKAFDIVDHQILANKLSQLDLHPSTLNWIISFLSNRNQITKIGTNYSTSQKINRGIVQGSVLGPTLYAVMKTDLRSKSKLNIIFKFADDTTLLVPENTDVNIGVEFDAIKTWTVINKMRLNMAKTKEIILHRPSTKFELSFDPVDAIEVVREAKLLGVFISDTFSMERHINYILKCCAQRVYLMKLLRSQGLPFCHLNTVAHALIISRLLYAAPFFRSFMSAAHIDRVNAFLKKIYRYGIVDKKFDFKTLLEDADNALFAKVGCPSHCLHHLLPSSKQINHLRSRGHSYELPVCKYNLYKFSFIPRCLYANV